MVLLSCRKDPTPCEIKDISTYDTIYPSEFLPVYPGSWWQYGDLYNGLSNVYRDSVVDWVLVPIYLPDDPKKNVCYRNYCYLPEFVRYDRLESPQSGPDKYKTYYVYGNGYIQQGIDANLDSFTSVIPFFASTADSAWTINRYTYTSSGYYSLSDHPDSNMWDTVLRSESFWVFEMGISEKLTVAYRSFFAKDLGIYMVSVPMPDSRNYQLEDYYIAPH